MRCETILYGVDGAVATITLNRPDELNTIVPPMPDEIEAAVHEAVRAAIAQRDGAFGDYSQAPKDRQPDPSNVIAAKPRSSS